MVDGFSSTSPVAEGNTGIPIELGRLLAELLDAQGPGLLIATGRGHCDDAMGGSWAEAKWEFGKLEALQVGVAIPTGRSSVGIRARSRERSCARSCPAAAKRVAWMTKHTSQARELCVRIPEARRVAVGHQSPAMLRVAGCALPARHWTIPDPSMVQCSLAGNLGLLNHRNRGARTRTELIVSFALQG